MLSVFPSQEELANQAAARLASWLGETQEDFHLALSGGSTPARFLSALAGKNFAHLPWQRLHVYWCDERCVPPDHAESNFGLAWRLLLQHVPLSAAQIHRIPGELPAREAAKKYTRVLRQHAAPGLRWPRFDLALLGLGEDGHTASLFPGRLSADEAKLPVMAVTAQYQGRPAERVTLTPLVLNTARRVVFLVSGENKSAALAGTLRGGPDPVRWPAQRIQLLQGQRFWWVDEAAARGLE